MRESCFMMWLLLAAAPLVAAAAELPDTGQTTCFTDSAADPVPASDPASVARDAGTHPRQDCRYGRDPAVLSGNLIRTGGGAKSFDYSKIANNGTLVPLNASLGTAATDWACTRDNLTGLTWEVKTTSAASLRYALHLYAWLDDNASTNGGNAGSAGVNTCNGTLPGNQCNTQAYVAAVNAANLCGHADWRLPSVRELSTLHYAVDTPADGVDPAFLPNTSGLQFWTSATYAFDTSSAWEANAISSSTSAKTSALYVWVVRGGPF